GTRAFIAKHKDLRALRMATTAEDVRHITESGSGFYELIAAIMLSLELFGNDVEGLGSRFPNIMQTADDKLRKYFADSRTWFLDYYLPKRDQSGQEFVDLLSLMIEAESADKAPK